MHRVLLSRKKKPTSALKHGGYAATVLLPGEDPAAFQDLHEELIAEFAPAGALEEHTVATLARLVWRRENLATCHRAEQARARVDQISSQNRDNWYETEETLAKRAEVREATTEATESEAREELGDSYQLVEIGHSATVRGVMDGFGVEEYLDTLIDRCLKRLLHVKGLKSLLRKSSPVPLSRAAGREKSAA